MTHGAEINGMFGAAHGFHELERLLEERQDQIELPGFLIGRGEVIFPCAVWVKSVSRVRNYSSRASRSQARAYFQFR